MSDLLPTCPSDHCGELNAIGAQHCTTCGYALVPGVRHHWPRLKCIYCSAKLDRGRLYACEAHSDLPRLDPWFREMVA